MLSEGGPTDSLEDHSGAFEVGLRRPGLRLGAGKGAAHVAAAFSRGYEHRRELR